MQELRFILIIVGALFIAAILFHGLWTSKKEGRAKFGDKPLGKLEPEDELASPAPLDDYEIIRKTPSKSVAEERNPFDVAPVDSDPLFDGADPVLEPVSTPVETKTQVAPAQPEPKTEPHQDSAVEVDMPSFSAHDDLDESVDPLLSAVDENSLERSALPQDPKLAVSQPDKETETVGVQAPSEPEPEMEVIVLNVHCSGEQPFVGERLFESMKDHGLVYGEMAIYHRHVDLSGTGSVLFSVANMMQPGTLDCDDPTTYTTKGISFFMTLPGYGNEEQNFNIMLQTAQQIADDLGGHVLDERRNLITPDRIKAYRRQIAEFNTAKA